MKLTAGLVAAFASCAAAARQAAEVYMLPRPDSSTPSVPRDLARLILLQRLAPSGNGPSTSEIPDGATTEDVVALMNQFGKARAPLFTDGEATSRRQLVVMLEGMTEEQISDMDKSFGKAPAFTISNPPAAEAHEKLVENDINNAGVTKDTDCSVSEFVNLSADRCWSGKSAVTKVNVQKDAGVLKELRDRLANLQKLAEVGDMQTTIVMLPEVAETSNNNYWSDKSQELRRRQEAEQVMSASDDDASAAPILDTSTNPVFHMSSEPLPSCFNSEDSCSSGTGNCTGRGACVNKYANPDGTEGDEVCYQCACLSTVDEKGSLTHWAGPTCSKQDVSVAFWLFAGFTLVMVTVLWLSISMLFNVGEEKLPGVIGAGVSRSK